MATKRQSLSVNVSAASRSWAARSTGPGVVWAHNFDSTAELTKHLNPAGNADFGNDVTFGVSPDAVIPHILSVAQDGQVQCLEITQLGGELAATLNTSAVTTNDWADAVLDPTSSTTASLSLPLAAVALGIVNTHSTLRIVNGANAGLFLNVTSTPVVGAALTFTVQTSARTPLVAQTSMQIQHVKLADPANLYEEVVIDEHVAEVGAQTWPSPTGWSAGAPTVVPTDAYSVVLQYDTTISSIACRYVEKVTVVKKVYNGGTQLSTLTVRRAAVTGAYDKGGDLDSNIVNRFFPCEFPVGTLIGRDVTGGWTRPLAALVAGDNGQATADLAASGTVPRRTLYNGATKATSFRTGYYGHADYHGQYTALAPFTPNTISTNGALPFNGDQFYLAWKMKLSPMFANRVDSSKLFFIDQYQTPDQSQIVGSSPKIGRLNWSWFHNFGNAANSTFPTVSWEPPLGDWFALKVHINAGHDNRMSYNDASIAVASATNNVGAQTMTLTCGLIPLAQGLVLPSTRYPASPQNPTALDPQRSGYFNNWKVVFKAAPGGGVLAGQSFKIVSHAVSGGTTTLVLEKLNALDTWPTATPAAGSTFRIDWISMDLSARYKDTHIELYKREAGDSDWVLLSSFDWAITFNSGTTDSSAGNPKGWNNFQPTGYANINDGNPPGSHTVYSRFGEVILSHADIVAPAL